MGDNSPIEWTGATWNPITGCTVISEGCRNCYAMRLAGTRMKSHPTREGLTRLNAAGKPVWNGQVRLIESTIDQPVRWTRPRMIFVGAHTDLFQHAVPDEWLDRLFAVMHRCPQHTFQILTKRPKRMRDYMQRQCHSFLKPMPNVWLGVSAEDQATADERIPYLLDTPAAIRWLSAEPLLGPIDLTNGNPGGAQSANYLTGWLRDPTWRLPGLDWVVVGGESGPGSRPMHPDWARALRDQCGAAGVKFFFKQWGDWRSLPVKIHAVTVEDRFVQDLIRQIVRRGGVDTLAWWRGEWCDLGENEGHPPDGCSYDDVLHRVGKGPAGRLLDGTTHDAMPGVQP